jgi:pSer/pThr/pTyr-binding forkhead associated (FHA) protein
MNDDTQQLVRPNFRRASALVNIETRVRHPLTGERLAVGRLPENKIALPDDIYVSSLHAVFFFEGQAWWLQDLNSTNGTLKNQSNVTERVPIEPGDVITIGRAKFEVV